MMLRTGRNLLISSAVLLTGIGVAGIILYSSWERPYDPTFDARVTDPAYRGGGPKVLYDEGHLNPHTADGAYKPFADLIRNDGYDLHITRQALTAQELEDTSVLVVVLASGANDTNDAPAFTDSETAVIDRWVRSGGSLLLVTDHWPFGAAAASLAERFEIRMGMGLVEDPAYHEPDRGSSHLVFSVDNGLLQDHPILRGRDTSEHVQRVLTFTGQSLHGPSTAVSFLALSDAATEWQPGTPTVERNGRDIRVNMEYGAPITVAGRAQGLALEVEAGRVVVLGEAGMLRAQRERNGNRVGMNVPGYDNRQLALNIMHWLSRAF